MHFTGTLFKYEELTNSSLQNTTQTHIEKAFLTSTPLIKVNQAY